MLRCFFLFVVLLTLAGCRTMPSPGLSLKDANLAEGPVLIQRGDHFYLRYRRNLDPQGQNLLSPLVSKRKGDSVYYYFTTPTSATEWGNLVERPLAYDGYEDFARNGKVYWLDPGGVTHPLPIRQE